MEPTEAELRAQFEKLSDPNLPPPRVAEQGMSLKDKLRLWAAKISAWLPPVPPFR